MEKRGGTRRTGRRHEEGERMTKEGKGVKKKRKREVTREADENGPFSRIFLKQKVQHFKCELKHNIKEVDFSKHKKYTNNEKELN